ncbi:L-gulonolactone oxidase-like [Diadema antillarum]|uniref:L-gulonolactone oxidase-like n=1 Tax=Diadema antillarum TaxID=105358 RepID=UPI003A8429D4
MEGYTFQNWAQTFSCQPELYFEPDNVEELKQILARAREEGKRVKVCGSRHSPSDIACTTGFMINMKNISRVISVDKERCHITVEAGVKLETLNEEILPQHDMALSLLGAISEQTVAGAISTGTHGTGYKHGIIATNILDLDLMKSSGEIVHCSEKENPDLFSAALCGLGALGIIVTVTIQCERTYWLHDLTIPSTLDDVLDNLDQYVTGSEHFRFFWYPHTDFVMMSKVNRTEKKRTEVKSSWFWDTLVGFYLLEFFYWLSTFFPPLVAVINKAHFYLFVALPRERVDISYKIFNFDCLFKQLVTDWAIPRDKTTSVLRELKRSCETENIYAHFPVEVRFTRSDDIMISPANGRDTCFINIIHFTPYGKKTSNPKYWALYEDIVHKAGGRPHWAKEHPLGPKELSELYPRWGEFCGTRKQLDPHGMFLNEYLERIFGL